MQAGHTDAEGFGCEAEFVAVRVEGPLRLRGLQAQLGQVGEVEQALTEVAVRVSEDQVDGVRPDLWSRDNGHGGGANSQ